MSTHLFPKQFWEYIEFSIQKPVFEEWVDFPFNIYGTLVIEDMELLEKSKKQKYVLIWMFTN